MHPQEKQGEFPRTLAFSATPGGPGDTTLQTRHGPGDISLTDSSRARAGGTETGRIKICILVYVCVTLPYDLVGLGGVC